MRGILPRFCAVATVTIGLLIGGCGGCTTEPEGNGEFEEFEEGEECGTYEVVCGGRCLTVANNPDHCGECDQACGEEQACASGQCVASEECPGTTQACGRRCVDTSWESTDCGECGASCDDGQGCVQGQCVAAIELNEPPAGFCEQFDGPIDLGATVGCAGNLAESTFRWGACSCDGFSMNGPLVVDAYDSRLGPYIPGGPGGGIGTNGSINGNEKLDISGSVWAGGSLDVNESSFVGQYLRLGGDLDISGDGELFVGADASVGGDISVEEMIVANHLFVSTSSELEGQITAVATFEEEIEIPRPCGFCDGDERINVAGIVDAHREDNDNQVIGLDPRSLQSGTNEGMYLELPCGRYFLDEIDRSGPTTIVATGNTALFIGGDIHANTEFIITLTPNAQLDIFVAGSVNIGRDFQLGSPNYPALLRMYVGGPSGLRTNDAVQLSGFVYAVPGRLDTNQAMEIFGGVYAAEITTNDLVTIHYDRRIASASRECPEPNPGDGSNPGEGPDPVPTCGSGGSSCDTNGDCCAPLVCHEESCTLLTCGPVFETCTQNSDCCSNICGISGDEETGICVIN